MRYVRSGRLEMITGPMFSGKTEELIRRIQRLKIAGYSVQVFHPKIDDRYSKDSICSHSGAKVPSTPLSSVKELDKELDKDKDVFAFDEVQFFEGEIMTIIDDLRKKGKIVLASGLNQDFAGRPFKFKDKSHIGELIAMSDHIIHLTAVCTYKDENGICEGIATRTQRLVDGKPASTKDDLVVVGGKDKYEARCVKHHFVS